EGIAETGMGTDDHKSFPCIELPGAKLYNELPGSFDAVLRLVSVNGQRAFQTQEGGGAIAGIRVPKGFGEIPFYIKPNVNYVIRCVQGDKSVLPLLALGVNTAKQTTVLRR